MIFRIGYIKELSKLVNEEMITYDHEKLSNLSPPLFQLTYNSTDIIYSINLDAKVDHITWLIIVF